MINKFYFFQAKAKKITGERPLPQPTNGAHPPKSPPPQTCKWNPAWMAMVVDGVHRPQSSLPPPQEVGVLPKAPPGAVEQTSGTTRVPVPLAGWMMEALVFGARVVSNLAHLVEVSIFLVSPLFILRYSIDIVDEI